jgi:hypothetical protein
MLRSCRPPAPSPTDRVPTQRRARAVHEVVVCIIALILATAGPAPAHATASAGTSATLHVRLVPKRLGHDTTIEFGFKLQGEHGRVPPPVTTIALLYPHNFGIFTSGLGLASCTVPTLEALGPKGCPSRSLMGYGTATGAVQVGNQVVDEKALTEVFMAPFENGEIVLSFFLDAFTPLEAERVFRGALQPASPPYGGALTITVPLIESFAEGPDVALVKLRSTIGPLGITYYERVHGEFVPYKPRGVMLPRRCPRGGFPFAARFAFADGEQLTASKKVLCPRRRTH